MVEAIMQSFNPTDGPCLLTLGMFLRIQKCSLKIDRSQKFSSEFVSYLDFGSV